MFANAFEREALSGGGKPHKRYAEYYQVYVLENLIAISLMRTERGSLRKIVV